MTDVHARHMNAHYHDNDHHHHGEDDHHHDHDHHHEHSRNILVKVAEALHLPGFTHDHSYTEKMQDRVWQDNELGIRTVKLALVVLGITTILQIFIYLASGSVALLADTVHNLGDALNSVPLWIALVLARRLPNKRYTYGYGRAEDVAGLLIVVSIAFSAGYILYESVQKLINPQPLEYLGAVAAAALIGFTGNELVAIMQIRVGRRIGSDAMIADGLHARVDGLTSLAVLIAVAGTLLGAPILDPIIGIVIGFAIIGITWGAAKSIWFRLMDAVDPAFIAAAESVIEEHEEIKGIERLQMHWVGHRLNGEITLRVESGLSVRQTHDLAGHIRHHLSHEFPNSGDITIETIPVD